MKNIVIILKLAFLAIMCAGFLIACKSDDSQPIDPAPSGAVISADTISNHLRFLTAEKIAGDIPKGPSGSSLQISLKDTLYLLDEVLVPIKFRHEDVSEDVTGVYLQVSTGDTGGTYYYDIPETPQKAESDSISVIMVGISPVGIVDPNGPPASGLSDFEIIITPHGQDGQPIATEKRPVKISVGSYDPNGSCSLVNPAGEYWEWTDSWDGSEIWGPETEFGGGQDISGCCANGVSNYGVECLNGNPEDERTLHFPTSYRIMSETIVFIDNGTFVRNTFENTVFADPDKSDFCGTGPGFIVDNINHVTYEGNWTINTVPPIPPYDNTFKLSMVGTSSTGFGFGNRGGFIHQLD